MDYLQYRSIRKKRIFCTNSFKPYYKWITFNTLVPPEPSGIFLGVLNLIINGLPSIPRLSDFLIKPLLSFKPYYKWITFNINRLNEIEFDLEKF